MNVVPNHPRKSPNSGGNAGYALGLCLLGLLAGAVRAQGAGGGLNVVDENALVQNRLGKAVDPNLAFRNHRGETVRLADFFGTGRPVVLNLNYYGCPSLCGAVQRGLVAGLAKISLEPGSDFEVVTVSIDPREGPELAAGKRNSILEAYPRDGARDHWHFLVGEEGPIRSLADAVGFGYQWNEYSKQWDHSAVIILLSPEGTVTRYLFPRSLDTMEFGSRDLRLGIVESSQGKVGTIFDRILLTCYGYDDRTRTYSLMAVQVMRIGGVITVVLIGGLVLFLWRRERRRPVPATP